MFDKFLTNFWYIFDTFLTPLWYIFDKSLKNFWQFFWKFFETFQTDKFESKFWQICDKFLTIFWPIFDNFLTNFWQILVPVICQYFLVSLFIISYPFLGHTFSVILVPNYLTRQWNFHFPVKVWNYTHNSGTLRILFYLKSSLSRFFKNSSNRFLANFWKIFGKFLTNLWQIFDKFLKHFWKMFWQIVPLFQLFVNFYLVIFYPFLGHTF